MRRLTFIPRVALGALAIGSLAACSDNAIVAPRSERTTTLPAPVTLAANAWADPIDLGRLPGDNYVSHAWALNDRDQVVGRSWHIQEPGVEIGEAFLWTPDGPNAETGQMTALQRPPFAMQAGSNALDVNDAGVAVGWFAGGALIWTTDVGTPLPGSQAVAINNRGYVVLQTGSDASLWTPPGVNGSATGQSYPLGTFVAQAINERGEIVGSAPGGGAVVWRPDAPGAVTGTLTPLGSLGGGSTVALDINDRGEIVGYETTGSGGTIALLWQPTNPGAESGEWVDLSALLGATNAVASGINNKGDITGRGSLAPFAASQLWVWRQAGKPGSAGTLVALGNAFPPDVAIAKPGPAINNQGDVAYGLDGRATLWRR